jgi:SAM-dependent methyltransferase
VSRFDDPAVVRDQYATEANLRARQALWREVEGENAPEVLWRVLASFAPLGRVLEVGGGQGELAERMQRELGAAVTFVDQSERMVELARGRGIETARVGDVQQLPFEDTSFDLAVAAWMLYHVADLDRGLAEIARVLRPGGRLVAVTNSLRHLEEFRALVGIPTSVLEDHFNSENGEASLLRHFARVERVDTELVAVVRDRETLVAYRNSMSSAPLPVPEHVELPFRVSGRSTIFVASR